MCNIKHTYQHGKKPFLCPNSKCQSEWWSLPKTECQLFYLQREYLKTRDPKILVKKYELLKIYSRSLVLKTLGGKYQMDSEILNEKSHDIAIEIVSLYLRKSSFKIDKSFGGYLQFKVKQELFGAKEEESHESLHQVITTKGSNKVILDTLQIFGFNSLFLPNINFKLENEDLVDGVLKIINSAVKGAQKEIDYIDYIDLGDIDNISLFSLYFLVALKNKIAGKTTKFMNKYYSAFGQEVKAKSEKVLADVYRHLKGEAV